MNTEEMTQARTPQEPLHFDAHEFDGLRDGSQAYANTLLERADRFIRTNPWLCMTIALTAGCALAGWLARRSPETKQDECC